MRICQLVVLLFLSGITTVASAQPNFAFSRNAQQAKLLQSALERDLDSLLEAISTYDKGNFDVVKLRGLQSSGPRAQSTFNQIFHDERVRGIYGLLRELPKEESSSIVSKSFRTALSKVQKGRTTDSAIYGLHAKLWLSLEFGSNKEFESNLSQWSDWHASKAAKIIAESGTSQSVPRVGPEPLMFLNLTLIESLKRGDAETSAKLNQLLADCGLKYYFADMASLYDETEEHSLVAVPLFVNWGQLGGLSVLEQGKVMAKARAIMGGSGLEDKLQDFLSNDEVIDGLVDRIIRLRNNQASLTGTRIEFLGAEDAKSRRLAKKWSKRAPLKGQMASVLQSMLSRTSPDERKKWNEIIKEFDDWLEEIPEDGITVNKKTVWEWPKGDANSGENEQEGEKVLKLRLTLCETTAFRDESSKKYLDEQAEARKALIEFSRGIRNKAESKKTDKLK